MAISTASNREAHQALQESTPQYVFPRGAIGKVWTLGLCNPGSITQGPLGEGAGQAAVEGGSLGGAAVVQSAGIGFVVQGTSNGSVVSPAVTHALE